MELKEYLQSNGLSVYLFSSVCRLSIPVIYRVLRNENIAPKSAKRICNATKGTVDYKNIMTFHGATPADDD